MKENQIKWVISIKIVFFAIFIYTEIKYVPTRFIFKLNFTENIVNQSNLYTWYKNNSS